MKRAGMQPYIAEPAHPLLREFDGDGVDLASYSQFSARYGNIYTSRQCLELCQQALGLRPAIDDFAEHDGRWFDLMRPNIEKQGFASLVEARADRAYHLSRVRLMFETADVFIFTLGLTECWYHAQQGHTYPSCPGTVRGEYLPALHRFRNLSHAEVVADLQALLALLAEVNPWLKLILTVSPVPLVATHTQKNVLVASSYSKAVLRAAAGEVEALHAGRVSYFPSYEIISHAASFGQYLASDLREVSERGVAHVMSSFLASYWGIGAGADALATLAVEAPVAAGLPAAGPAPLPECEEIFNQPR